MTHFSYQSAGILLLSKTDITCIQYFLFVFHQWSQRRLLHWKMSFEEVGPQVTGLNLKPEAFLMLIYLILLNNYLKEQLTTFPLFYQFYWVTVLCCLQQYGLLLLLVVLLPPPKSKLYIMWHPLCISSLKTTVKSLILSFTSPRSFAKSVFICIMVPDPLEMPVSLACWKFFQDKFVSLHTVVSFSLHR